MISQYMPEGKETEYPDRKRFYLSAAVLHNLKMTTLPKEILEQLYAKIHADGISAVADGTGLVDPHLRIPEADTRFGITLLIEPDRVVSEKIFTLGEEIKSFEPDQYYYPLSDLHITVTDLIGAHTKFRRSEEQIGVCRSILADACQGVASFELRFDGSILSPGGVLVKGYYREGLSALRERIRYLSNARGFSLQERYQSISAHMTLMRFAAPPADKRRLLTFIEKHRFRDLGRMEVRRCTLVLHDWYNRRKEVLGVFTLTG